MINFWQPWLLVAAHGLPLVASGGHSPAVCGLPVAAVSLAVIAEHRLHTWALSGCSSWAQWRGTRA